MRFFKSGSANVPVVMRKSGIYAALDIGASKTVCLITKIEQTLAGSHPRVIGVGHQSTRGLRSGQVVDAAAVEESIQSAVDAAEHMARCTVNEVYLAVSVGAPSSTRISVDMDLAAREVTDRDLDQIRAEALRRHHEPGRFLLHALLLSWRVDGYRGVKYPRGMLGKTLGVEVHLVSAASDPVQNLITCVERCQLSVVNVSATPYVSGIATLVADECDLGVLVIDMGAHTTTAAVFNEGVFQHVDGVPVGGAHVTNDIARGLSTPINEAERIKTLRGSALDGPDDDQIMIEIPPVTGQGAASMFQKSKASLNAIIRPRLEEIFELVHNRLDAAGVTGAAGCSVVLTGGASRLPGIAELAARILGKQVRLGCPDKLAGLPDAARGPDFSAVAGLLIQSVRGPAEMIPGTPRFDHMPAHIREYATSGRGVKALWSWFAESF